MTGVELSFFGVLGPAFFTLVVEVLDLEGDLGFGRGSGFIVSWVHLGKAGGNAGSGSWDVYFLWYFLFLFGTFFVAERYLLRAPRSISHHV